MGIEEDVLAGARKWRRLQRKRVDAPKGQEKEGAKDIERNALRKLGNAVDSLEKQLELASQSAKQTEGEHDES